MIVAIEQFKESQTQYRKIPIFFKDVYLQNLHNRNPFRSHEEYNVNYYEPNTNIEKHQMESKEPTYMIESKEPTDQIESKEPTDMIEQDEKEIVSLPKNNKVIRQDEHSIAIYMNPSHSLIEELYEKNIYKINWDALSKNRSIPFRFFEKHIDKINFKIFCKYQMLESTFIEKYMDKIDFFALSSNQFITHDMIEKYCIKLNWKELCKNNSIPWKFLYRNIDIIIEENALAELYSHEQIPLDHILRIELQFNKCTDLTPMLTKKKMTYEFIKKCQAHKLITEHNFDHLWENPYLEIEFVRDYIDKVNWKKFCGNIKDMEETLLSNIYYINITTWRMYCWMLLGWCHPHWTALCSNPHISEKVFDIIIGSDIFLADRIDWDALCRNDNISEGFFFYYSHKINWTSICYNKNITTKFFELFIEKVDWNSIHLSPNLTIEFIYKHIDKMVVL
jgi:hypothetical protein